MIISCMGGPIVWLSIASIQLGLIGMAAYCIYYRNLKYDPEESTYKYLTWAGYAIGGIWFLVFVLVCCCYQSIRVGIAIY